MNFSVYIRPLQIEDAKTSVLWRNDPKIWRHTGSKPDREITLEIETTWLTEVLKRPNEKRFAICTSAEHKYIGNIYLTHITDKDAEVHMFIGDMKYWGKGRAAEALSLIFTHGLEVLGLDAIYTEIRKTNLASLALGKRIGFQDVSEYFDESTKDTIIRSVYTKEMFDAKLHLRSLQTDQNTGDATRKAS